MSWIDWGILFGTLAIIVIYGVYKTRKNSNLEGYLKGNNTDSWATIGLSVMATQASAITFLSTPGQAYESGMGFVQFYFGLPIAMIIISVFILPIYYKLKVFTAYQYLEQRFDVKVRSLTAFLFLVSRGLAAGLTIYAPAIILTSLLGWNLQLTCILIGTLVIVYTVSGGSRAVSLTQKWQMAIIMIGMFIAFYFILDSFPDNVGFSEGLDIAGAMNKMQIINTSTDITEKYTLLSGFTGAIFLFLSYFGTDQSQVQRYLGGKSLKASRIGLMFNGLVKIPMQFFILLVGVMLFVSFQFNKPPVIFNASTTKITANDDDSLRMIDQQYNEVFIAKQNALDQYLSGDEAQLKSAASFEKELVDIRSEYKDRLKTLDENYEKEDNDFIFLSFVLDYMPVGLIGLLLAVIFSAAMSSTAGELNALASTTTIDYYKKFFSKSDDDKKDVRVSKLLTVGWGILAIVVALVAGLFDNLIELVNIIGSLFYGTILGVFLLAFFIKFVKARSAFIAALIGQSSVLILHYLTVQGMVDLSYLLYNIIGSFIVVLAGITIEMLVPQKEKT
ncbi:sodium:solute symporter [Paracrocinitomix mangrovi]|uniref:sodium:solute symporter n=1 Tax=Paracrocinitomix mangrovi TaxID=2862509 RepID=UPI001C8D3BFB|nr:sodium:solute symporter [Paracrocinitomix mangrovi]UKN02356.1 sodium:solute symporter [Paracrocinitomix mangrovi]